MIRANLKTGGSGITIKGNIGCHLSATNQTDMPTLPAYPNTASSGVGQIWFDVTDYDSIHIDVDGIANGTASTWGKLIYYVDNDPSSGVSLGLTGTGTSPSIPADWTNGVDIDVSGYDSIAFGIASNNYSVITCEMTIN